MNINDIKNPPKKYRPIPFWSWNEKLDTEETRRQVRLMNDAGMGGFFMHARGGLQTEYMGQEWFQNVGAATDEAKKCGMYAWGYDENGWPSGFGGGLVNGLGEKYQLKYLRMEYGEKNTDKTICNIDGVHFYYEPNPFYVDNLDKEVVREFIDRIYEPYYEKFSGEMVGFFTDEPQLSRVGIPWSFVLPSEYEKEYGEELFPKLIELFENKGDYKNTRIKFRRLITKLFHESFSKQIYDWCNDHGFEFTGHFLMEDSLQGQVDTSGAVMPGYEYYHIPGVDFLGRRIGSPVTPLQCSSVAHQMGRKQVLTESFALCGHNVSFDELKWVVEWQMVRGINLLCPHLEGYSLRGIRKRDYPPAMNYQQPWWKDYKHFVDAMSRIGMLIAEGRTDFETLLIHPQSTAWAIYADDHVDEVREYNQKFLDAIAKLEGKHILFDLGDEIIMERHAKVVGNKLVIGKASYSTVVMLPDSILLGSTKILLDEFISNGGRVITPEEAKENEVIDNPIITYTKRQFDDFDMHYFVNTTQEVQKSTIKVGNGKLNVLTGEIEPLDKNFTFESMASIVVLDVKKNAPGNKISAEKESIIPEGEWEIKTATSNSFVLDYCDCYFDGNLFAKNIHINQIQEAACALKRKVDVHLVFKVNAEYCPSDIKLVCETPEIFKFRINGKDVSFSDEGYFIDKAFRKADISEAFVKGENIIELFCDFEQTDTTYENIEKSKIFESEKNKLSYDMEIEAMYLIGDFSVKCKDGFTFLDKKAVRSLGEFAICEPQKSVELKNIEQQGFAFFAGTMTLCKKISVDDTDKKLKFTLDGINSANVKVNGKDLGTLVLSPFEFDLSDALNRGENEFELTLTNNLRNLLGPHHLEEGESHMAAPACFFKESEIWNGKPWNDAYCLVETNVNFK